jgi:hypothetical protein
MRFYLNNTRGRDPPQVVAAPDAWNKIHIRHLVLPEWPDIDQE